MLEKEAIQQRGFRNVMQEGQAVGYQLRVRSLYYRGLWLSQITRLSLQVDGQAVDNSRITCTVSGITCPVEELKTRGDVHWGILEPMVLTVLQEGGLACGAHTVEVDIMHSSSYMPPDMDWVLSTQGQKRELVLV